MRRCSGTTPSTTPALHYQHIRLTHTHTHTHTPSDSHTLTQGLVLYNNRIVIPQDMRTEILETRWPSSSVWWPGISKRIREAVSTCRVCRQEIKPTRRREPLICTPLPSRPPAHGRRWQQTCASGKKGELSCSGGLLFKVH